MKEDVYHTMASIGSVAKYAGLLSGVYNFIDNQGNVNLPVFFSGLLYVIGEAFADVGNGKMIVSKLEKLLKGEEK